MMKYAKRALVLALALALCLGGALPARADASIGIVTGGRLHLRATPAPDGEVIGTYPNHTVVSVTGVQGDWYEVEVGSARGFMEARFVQITSTAVVRNGGSYVNLRSSATRTDNIIARYGSGTMVTILAEEAGGWCYIDVDGTRGYMASSFLEAAPAGSEATHVPVIDGETGAVAVPEGQVLITAEPVEADQPDATEAEGLFAMSTDGEGEVVHQVGQSQSEASMDGGVQYTVYYPRLDIEAADQTIATWIKACFAEATGIIDDEPEGSEAEITIQYDSFLLSDHYIGVLETGFIDSALLAHPYELILTVNADRETGEVLGFADIFTPGRLDDVVAMLRAELERLEGDVMDGVEMDATWLTHALIAPEGIMIVLPRAAFLPSYLGTLAVTLSYGALREAGVLGLDITAQPQATPMPVAAPTAAPTPTEAAQRTIDPGRPMIALTFDDGPSDYTLHILDILEKHGARATFCMVGNRIAEYSDVVAQVAAQGSEIATHTWSHKNLTSLSQGEIASQLKKSVNAIERVTGQKVTTMRPPYGAVDSDVRAACRTLGLKIATWSIDTEDWKTNNADSTYRAIMNHVKNGSIILCHDTKPSTATAMERVIPELVEKGYQFVTLTELLSFSKTHGQPGTVYNHLDTSGL